MYIIVLGMLLDNGTEQCVTAYTLRNRTCRICRVRFETQGLLPKPGVLEEKKLFTKSRFSPNSHFPLPTNAATLSEQKKSRLPSLEFQNREVLEQKRIPIRIIQTRPLFNDYTGFLSGNLASPGKSQEKVLVSARHDVYN